jgi:hypothetical protein
MEARCSESPRRRTAGADAKPSEGRRQHLHGIGVYPSDLNDRRLLEFTPNNESFDQLAKNLGFQCFLYKLTSTATPGIQSGWNFSLCTIFHDRVTEYCIDKTCQVVSTNTSETKDSCPPP